ncbi:DUF3813 family protein [Bacillus lacus]|uniref:DUF3813 family protein n=1 Tax=Metabacillus lacus TaxID=1983721 RepID=A0A7X2J2N8_9BACI|nr:DUF3813 domain-containing protein [Metabacillus lacus]MRX73483.1 DUF3813 family protein [Metabacillus lacus]
MGNQLFQKAREYVSAVEHAQTEEAKGAAVLRAKQALSSAFANSTTAEKVQLHDMQDQLEEMN